MKDVLKQTLLAIDTATEACSAALQKDGATSVRYQIAPQKHNTLIFDMCRQLFSGSGTTFDQLDALIFGRGPGSFTGVRIAVSLAQSVTYTRDIPLVPVSNLKAVAQIAMDKYDAENICVAMDARMEEIYYACFRRNKQGIAQKVTEEAVLSPAKIQAPKDFNCIGVGTGWKCAGDVLSQRLGDKLMSIDPDILPTAEIMLKLAHPQIQSGKTHASEQITPTYLRNPLHRGG